MENVEFDVLIEIPRGSRNKYEYDYEHKAMRFDRMLFSAMRYPGDYGYIPNTLALDGDPLDVIVMLTEPTFPGCVIRVRPVGLFNMADEKGPDSKVLCVPVSEPIWNKYHKLSDINPHLLSEIEHFFAVYKDLEKKKVEVQGWEDEKAAIAMYHESLERYKETADASV